MTRSVGRATVLRRAAVLAVMVTSVACLGSSSTDPTPAVEAGQGQAGFSILDGLRAGLVEAHATGDADAIASLFTETGSLQLPSGAALANRSEIRDHYAGWFAQFIVELELLPESSKIEDAQKALENGTFSLKLRPRDGGSETSHEGTYDLEGSLGTGGVKISSLQLVSGT